LRRPRGPAWACIDEYRSLVSDANCWRPEGRAACHRESIGRDLIPAAAVLTACLLLAGCGAIGLNPEQRAASIEFGKSLAVYGKLMAEETSHVRSEVKHMRVLALSMPSERSRQLFAQGGYTRLGEGLDEPRLEKLVALGGGADRFGSSLAKVADLNSTTADEKLFSTASYNFVLVASSLAEGLANVSVAAPAVNLVTFASTDAYRRRIITQSLRESEPTARAAIDRVNAEFTSDDPGSLLVVYSGAAKQLARLLENGDASFRNADLSATDRNLVATAYRALFRNREHMRYVTSRQQELAVDAEAAYQAMLATLNGENADLAAIDRFSNAVFQTSLAFESLR
jgi:hypothetical protein